MNNDIEKSIIKKFKKDIWNKFVKSINDYEMIKENDKIGVCISGGKDSMLLAKCFQELKKHGKIKFDLEFIVMNPGYTKEVKEKIVNNANLLNIPIHMFYVNIFSYVNSLNNGLSCYMCARMRRGHLYNKAKELGCNKIALGHHFDDVIETILLNILYAGEIKTMMPKLHSKNFKGLELIRPLYLVKEASINLWVKYNNLEFIDCACLFDSKKNESKRKEIKKLIKEFRKINPYIDINIFKSVENVNLKTIIGYKNNKERYKFLNNYDEQ